MRTQSIKDYTLFMVLRLCWADSSCQTDICYMTVYNMRCMVITLLVLFHAVKQMRGGGGESRGADWNRVGHEELINIQQHLEQNILIFVREK